MRYITKSKDPITINIAGSSTPSLNSDYSIETSATHESPFRKKWNNIGSVKMAEKCENKHRKLWRSIKEKEWESRSAFYLTLADF